MPTYRNAGSRALEQEEEFRIVDAENTQIGEVPTAQAASALGLSDMKRFRVSAAPGQKTRVTILGTARALEESAEEYQLSEPPAPIEANVVLAQAAGVRGRAMAVVEIATTIAGAAMTRILDNEGDVNWELDQLNGALHPDGADKTPSGSAWQSKRIEVPGFWISNNLGQKTFGDFEITFQYNGASVGYIQVSPLRTGDGWGEGLTVKENIMPDPNTFTTKAGGGRFAAIKVRFQYTFRHVLQDDALAINEITVFGNGDYSQNARWTQAP